jgi:hypothetical protein
VLVKDADGRTIASEVLLGSTTKRIAFSDLGSSVTVEMGCLAGSAYVTATQSTGGVVEADDIATGSVTSAEIADEAITADKIPDGIITTANIATGGIDTANIANSAVTNDKIANGTIGESAIANGAIVAAKIGTNAVTDAAIADNSISAEKIADYTMETWTFAASAGGIGKDIESSTPDVANGGTLTSGDPLGGHFQTNFNMISGGAETRVMGAGRHIGQTAVLSRNTGANPLTITMADGWNDNGVGDTVLTFPAGTAVAVIVCVGGTSWRLISSYNCTLA